MKLRSKIQTEDYDIDEVIEANPIRLLIYPKGGGIITLCYDALEELLNEWEDAENDNCPGGADGDF